MRSVVSERLDAGEESAPPWVATEDIDAPMVDVVLLERGR
jgi:hypothetical protein